MDPQHEDQPTAEPVPALSEDGEQQNVAQAPCEDESVDEELTYNPGPPHRTFVVQVYYHNNGPGKPLPYPLDDGEDGVVLDPSE